MVGNPLIDRNFEKRHAVSRTDGDTPVVKVGFYGCVGRVVRVRGVDEFPWKLRHRCPACGHTHIVRLAWRKYIPKLDDGVDPDIDLTLIDG